MGFGFCPKCGTARVAADQKFCPVCGSGLAALAPAAPPPPPPPVAAAPPVATPAPAPVDWTSPAPPPAPEPVADAATAPPPPWAAGLSPATPPEAQPPAAPYWPAPAAGAPPAQPQWATPPAAPGAPFGGPATPYPPAYFGGPVQGGRAGIGTAPKLLAVGGIALIVVVIAAVVFMNMNSGSGGITLSPSTISCSSTTDVTSTVRLPSSLKADDELTFQIDGITSTTATVGEAFTVQSDGSWLLTDTQSSSSSCTSAIGATLSMGTHTLQILDASGKVLAQGSYTLTP